jgi:hypothetical protein
MEHSAQPDTPSSDLALIETDIQNLFQVFKHSPLDLEVPSIRIIRIIKALSPESYIQCEVRHALITTSYLCLSYVWGKEEEGQWISLNGQRFWIRNNLWQFLQSARLKPHIRNEWLWIDALSIDQVNNTEKNHQVQQMGRVFRNATRVISWLGVDLGIENYLRYCVPYTTSNSTKCALDSFISFGKPDSPPEAEPFGFSEYWTRAWVSKFWTRFVYYIH